MTFPRVVVPGERLVWHRKSSEAVVSVGKDRYFDGLRLINRSRSHLPIPSDPSQELLGLRIDMGFQKENFVE